MNITEAEKDAAYKLYWNVRENTGSPIEAIAAVMQAERERDARIVEHKLEREHPWLVKVVAAAIRGESC